MKSRKQCRSAPRHLLYPAGYMIAARVPGATIRWFLIEKMMPQGLELLIGGLRDEQFGPSIAFGLGGIWVEALKTRFSTSCP